MAKQGRAYLRRKHNSPKTKREGPIRNRIREWREFFGWSQIRLAEESGLDDGSISGYERGTIEPSIDALDKLGKAMGVSKGMLLDITPENSPTLWEAFLRATETQKLELARIADALIGKPQKSKR